MKITWFVLLGYLITTTAAQKTEEDTSWLHFSIIKPAQELQQLIAPLKMIQPGDAANQLIHGHFTEVHAVILQTQILVGLIEKISKFAVTEAVQLARIVDYDPFQPESTLARSLARKYAASSSLEPRPKSRRNPQPT